MRKLFICMAALAVTACQPADDTVSPAQEELSPAQEELVTADGDDLPGVQHLLPQGEYRVAGANGADVNLGHAITVSVTDDMIAVVSQCVTPRWTYRYVDNRIQTERVSEPICDRGRYPEEEAVSAVFDDPQDVMRTPSNGIYISGGGQSITLYSQ